MVRTLIITLVVATAALAVGANGGAASELFMFSPVWEPGWHLIGLPARPEPADPYTIFGSVPIDYRLFGWDPVLLRYLVFDPLQPDLLPSVVSGEGYWLDVDTTTNISYLGAPWQVGAVRPISLGPAGWHLIGNPHEVIVPLDYCMIEHEGTEVTLADAAAAGWISFPIYGWDPASIRYTIVGLDGPPTQDDTVLAPWAGYWFSTEVDNLRLMVQRPLDPGPFDAWLVGDEGMQQDYTVDLSKETRLVVLAAAPIYATDVQAIVSGPIPADVPPLFRADSWPLKMPFGRSFEVPNHGDPDQVFDYTIQVEATTAASIEYSVQMSLHVIGNEIPP